MRHIQELWALDEVLDKLAAEIQSLEEKRTAFASVLRMIRLQLDLRLDLPLAQDYLIDQSLATPVEPTELGGLRVCGVDGGLLKKSLRGFDLVITRASSTIFEYAPSGRVLAEYYPQQKTTPIVKADFYPKSWYEAEVNASLERIRTELELALKIIDHHPIDLLILDGTLTPHISDRPSTNSPLSTKYHEIKTLQSQLYEQTKEKAILLAGIVKDSRSNRFVKLLGELMPHLIKKYPELKPLLQMDYRFVVNSSYDTDLFFRILDVGERSAIFRFKNQGGKSNAQNMTPAVI